jgi:hypothetical protein
MQKTLLIIFNKKSQERKKRLLNKLTFEVIILIVCSFNSRVFKKKESIFSLLFCFLCFFGDLETTLFESLI